MVAVAFFAAATVVVAIFDSFTVLFHCIFHFFFFPASVSLLFLKELLMKDKKREK